MNNPRQRRAERRSRWLPAQSGSQSSWGQPSAESWVADWAGRWDDPTAAQLAFGTLVWPSMLQNHGEKRKGPKKMHRARRATNAGRSFFPVRFGPSSLLRKHPSESGGAGGAAGLVTIITSAKRNQALPSWTTLFRQRALLHEGSPRNRLSRGPRCCVQSEIGIGISVLHGFCLPAR